MMTGKAIKSRSWKARACNPAIFERQPLWPRLRRGNTRPRCGANLRQPASASSRFISFSSAASAACRRRLTRCQNTLTGLRAGRLHFFQMRPVDLDPLPLREAIVKEQFLVPATVLVHEPCHLHVEAAVLGNLQDAPFPPP